QEALAALDYKVYPEYKSVYPHTKNEVVKAVSCPYFTTNVLDFTQNTTRDYSNLDSFVIHVCVEGAYDLICNNQKYEVKKGDCVLIPNVLNDIQLATTSGFKTLETFVA
ncbi:MAG: mannose-6-phosphate isomerase, partial [Sphingobacteriaceae bacterium]